MRKYFRNETIIKWQLRSHFTQQQGPWSDVDIDILCTQNEETA